MIWVENASASYFLWLAIAIGVVLAVVQRFERRARRSCSSSHWVAPGDDR